MEQRSKSLRPSKSQVPHDIADNLGKIPPQAIDLEETVLGAIMLEKNAIIEVAGFLRPEHFYTEGHKEIYTAIQQLFGESAPIDMRTVVMKLRELGKLELVGGAYYIAELTSRVSSAANIEYHARKIMELSMKRGIIMLASEMMRGSYDDTTDIFDQIDHANLILQEIMDNVVSGKSDRTMLQIATEVVQEVQARQAGKLAGLASGYRAVDTIIGGFIPPDLIILAARPGMGKTTFALQAGEYVAQTSGPVGVFSLEMSSRQLVERMHTADSEIDGDKVKRGKMDQVEVRRFIDASGGISKLRMHIDDTPSLTIVELRARAIRMKTKYKIKLLIVDYLQLIRGTGRSNNRDQEIGEITRTLKGIAKELDIPVIALSQLSRGVETRGGTKRPQLSDLRESGNIEQDADIVIFLYRPEYYKITVDDDGNDTHGLCEVIVAKHRQGSTDTVLMKFAGKFTKFSDWEFGKKVDQQQYLERAKDVLPNEDRLKPIEKPIDYKSPLTPERNDPDDLPF